MAGTMNSVIKNRVHLSSLPYTSCHTRIVSLLDLDLPEHATEEEYRAIYTRYTQQSSPQNGTSNASLLRDAIESMKHGVAPPVAFPTETVYGLGADATNEPAVSGIFAAKGRPGDNPLIVHVASISHLERLTGEPLPEIYRSVAERFWPGPLTILLPVPTSRIFAKNVHPAQKTIGFRIPSSKYARFFIAATDKPIAGPSANSSGKPSPTTARHVLDDLKGKINFILDGGGCEVGVESTVVDGLHDPPLVLRPGGVSLEEFRALGREVGGKTGNKWAMTTIGYKRHEPIVNGGLNHSGVSASSRSPSPPGSSEVSEDSNTNSATESPNYEEDVNGAPRAPGMKYRHYAPKGRLILFSEDAFRAGCVEEKLDHIVDIAQSKFGSHEQQKKDHRVRVGIISCHWPPFAGLKDPGSPTIYLTNTSEMEKPNSQKPDPILNSVYAHVTSTTNLRKNDTDITLYNVHLGPEISTLAHSLFGVLRLFDDLDCAYILAETVRRSSPLHSPNSSSTSSSARVSGLVNGEDKGGKEQTSSRHARRDLEDAVIDRIEKAAAERVD